MSSDNVLTCLLWMLLIGPLQVIIGFIWFATTESPKIRKHFLIYLTGVLAYFVGLGIIHRPFHDLYRFPDY
ncbi:MAG TPA: hypothetical protein VHS96_17840, partial [Bacteroidia bacterium]|nr:hypothetical protein [Bacteroidia bacterium]